MNFIYEINRCEKSALTGGVEEKFISYGSIKENIFVELNAIINKDCCLTFNKNMQK